MRGAGETMSLATLVLALAFSAAAASPARACQVPVFRYALERWAPAPHHVWVVYERELPEGAAAAIERARAVGGEESLVLLGAVDASKPDEVPNLLRGRLDGLELPAIVVVEEGAGGAFARSRESVWRLPFSPERLGHVVDSPVRREIARRILRGQTAVWVFLESGDPARDRAALQVLEEELPKQAAKLRLPSPETLAGEEEFRAETPIELKIEFSTLRVSRQDAAEAFFVSALERVEPDLVDLRSEPMAIPIFGRGRGLYALTGEGINADTLGDALALLVGPCSCTVKDQNPGRDLPFAVDWEAGIDGSAIPAEAPVDLPAFASAQPAGVDAAAGEPPAAEPSAAGSPASPPGPVSTAGLAAGNPRKRLPESAGVASPGVPPPSGVPGEPSPPAHPVSPFVPIGGTAVVAVLAILAAWLLLRSRGEA